LEELDSLIKADLQPKDKMPAIQLAYYKMNRERPDFKHYEYVISHHSLLGRHFDIYKWKTEGHWFAKNICVLLQIIGGAYRQKKYPRPRKEDPNAVL
jgi:hypothetical protein